MRMYIVKIIQYGQLPILSLIKADIELFFFDDRFVAYIIDSGLVKVSKSVKTANFRLCLPIFPVL